VDYSLRFLTHSNLKAESIDEWTPFWQVLFSSLDFRYLD